MRLDSLQCRSQHSNGIYGESSPPAFLNPHLHTLRVPPLHLSRRHIRQSVFLEVGSSDETVVHEGGWILHARRWVAQAIRGKVWETVVGQEKHGRPIVGEGEHWVHRDGWQRQGEEDGGGAVTRDACEHGCMGKLGEHTLRLSTVWLFPEAPAKHNPTGHRPKLLPHMPTATWWRPRRCVPLRPPLFG
jgi:hypothetical protein